MAAKTDRSKPGQKAVVEPTPIADPVFADKPGRNQLTITKQQKKDRILELTEMGASIRQISDRLTEAGWTGCSRSNVGKLLKESIDGAIEENQLKAAHYVELEIRKERRKELSLMANLLRLAEADATLLKDDAIRGSKHADAVDKYSRSLERVTKRIDSLLGLHKPVKVEATGKDGAPLVPTIRVIMPKQAEADDEEE